MKPDEFQSLAEQPRRLAPHQKKRLAERLRELEHKQVANKAMEGQSVRTSPDCSKQQHFMVEGW